MYINLSNLGVKYYFVLQMGKLKFRELKYFAYILVHTVQRRAEIPT